MTNVPTNSMDALQEQGSIEQPQSSAETDDVKVENSQESSQAEVAETSAMNETTEANEVPTPKEPEAPAEEVKPADEPENAAEVKDVPAADNPEEVSDKTEAVAGQTDTEELKVDFEGEENPPKNIVVPDTKEGIIDRMNTLAEHPEQSEKVELDMLKQNFYRIIKAEKTQAYSEYLENGGKPEEYVQTEDSLEDVFKKDMSVIKEHRAELQEAAEHQKEINLEKKKAIIERIKDLAKTPDEANKNYDTFRKLQDEWKSIKPVPIQTSSEIWKNFQFCVEQYYDLLKENNALRDYDFKKNLESKTLLCEAAEKLVDDPDIINASHQLQQLHQEYREIGPVTKELRENLWIRFKTASAAINKRHAQYFEELKEKENENLEKKTALCEEIENIETANLQNYSEWDSITKKIIEIQQRWKEIGRAPKKSNVSIFERFRAACDNFFNKKAEHFKEQKKIYAENAAKKVDLCVQAEALKDSTDWNVTTNKLVQLQKQWKEVGVVSHKVSNSLWERFNAACNFFFEQRKKIQGDQHKEETTNLTKKKTIIDKLEAIAVEGGQDAAEKVRALMDEWGAAGHVPYKEKDKIYAQYHDIVDRLFKELNLSSIRRPRPRRNMPERNNSDYGNNRSRGNSLYRLFEAKKAELANYENNISFMTSHSKSGNSLIDAMNKKISALKVDLQDLAEKLKEQERGATEAKTAEKEAPAQENATAAAPVVEKSPATADEVTQTTPEVPAETPKEDTPAANPEEAK